MTIELADSSRLRMKSYRGESGLAVSCRPVAEIAGQTGRFPHVGWFWRAGASTPSAVCEMVRAEGPSDTQRYDKHTM